MEDGGTRYMGLSLYVAIGFSEASSEIAPESIFFQCTTLGIHSTTEIPAPKVHSATRGIPPFWRSMFLIEYVFQR